MGIVCRAAGHPEKYAQAKFVLRLQKEGHLAAVEAGERPVEGGEELDDETRAFESIALGLRRVAGFSRASFAAEFGQDPLMRHAAAIEETRDKGLIEVAGDAIRLTASGRLLANEALVAFAP